jgi:hypothetical protein
MENKVHSGILAHLDSTQDSQGHTFVGCKVISEEFVPVTMEFSKRFSDIIGSAKIKVNKKSIDYEIMLNADIPARDRQTFESMTPVMGGFIISRIGDEIKKMRIDSVGLTFYPSDRRLKTLKGE